MCYHRGVAGPALGENGRNETEKLLHLPHPWQADLKKLLNSITFFHVP